MADCGCVVERLESRAAARPVRGVCGSSTYAAPEVIRGGECDALAAGMWSLGVRLFGMINGFLPVDRAAPDWRCDRMLSRRRGRSTDVRRGGGSRAKGAAVGREVAGDGGGGRHWLAVESERGSRPRPYPWRTAGRAGSWCVARGAGGGVAAERRLRRVGVSGWSHPLVSGLLFACARRGLRVRVALCDPPAVDFAVFSGL